MSKINKTKNKIERNFTTEQIRTKIKNNTLTD